MTDRESTNDHAADADDAPMTREPDDIMLVLETERANAEAALHEQKDKLLRLAAEFDNFRKRAARDREAAEHHGQSVVIRGLLDALDDLSRFAHVDSAKVTVDSVVDASRMVEQKFLKSLAGHGLDVVNPVGSPFNPAVHEAVATEPGELPEDDNIVSQVYQVGYVFNGQLLRPARVVVKQFDE